MSAGKLFEGHQREATPFSHLRQQIEKELELIEGTALRTLLPDGV